MRRPKQDMLGLRMRIKTKAAKMIRIAVVVHFMAASAGSTAGASLVGFGLFLEDRDLGFLFFFPEVMTEAEHRAQRQHSQQELEEAFHQNLPYLILFKHRKKSIARMVIYEYVDLIFPVPV